MFGGPEEDIVEVEVREDPDGIHWGWFDNDDQEYCHIYPHEAHFRICFPYGPEAEEKAGKGRIVKLSVREIDGKAEREAFVSANSR
jgi:hypothetical protein